MIILKSADQISRMQRAGRVVHKAIRTVGESIRPGKTTGELEETAARIISESGGSSPFLGYAPEGHTPFPAWTCISVNNEIVHGIPGRRQLTEGDLVTVDCGVELDGWVADSAWTFPVGEVSPLARKLLRVTEEALYHGIACARPGRRLGEVSSAVQKHVQRHGFSVVRELVGHGVGTSLHEEPAVPNYGKPREGPMMQIGMTVAIEPMVAAGQRDIECLEDNWTIVTADGSLAAHFEHTVAIVSGGARILTNGD